ncbi:MAG: hypothetical protein O3B31_14375 [Chloroflexi bacterium]|nr:hypothetical protein [Chloroflexota bacterium]
MVFAIVLGMIVGAAGVMLLQQWLTGALMLGHGGVRDRSVTLSAKRFPHLAPPTRATSSRRAA